MLASTALAGDFPLKAHVVGKSKTDISTLGAAGWQLGNAEHIDLQVGDRVYTIERMCGVEVGKDYPARFDDKKIHIGLPNGRTCTARICGVREATIQ